MIYEKIKLSDYYENIKDEDITLTIYSPSNYNDIDINRKRKTVLLLPGGAYVYKSNRENEPIALRLVGEDINVFSLMYTTTGINRDKNIIFPSPLLEVYASIDFMRRNSDKYNVDINSISVMGASAGGNLAAVSACHMNEESFSKLLNTTKENILINGCILMYPVITNDPNITHSQSLKNVTNNNLSLESYFSAELNVCDNYPKTYIYHTTCDEAVNIKNSLMFMNALKDKNVFFEAHLYPNGVHGSSLCNRSVYSNQYSDEFFNSIVDNTEWIDSCIRFIKKYV